MVRDGLVLSAPHFSTKHGPGSAVDHDLVKQWSEFDLASALTAAFGMPTKVANDADIQGAAVIRGKGLELAITLGTGFGTGLFYEGQLMPHLEIAHQPFRKGETYNDQLGEAARKDIGEERWNKRVHKAIANLRALLFFDHLYIGGGNSRRVSRHHLPDDVTIVDNTAGILGGIKLWVPEHVAVNQAAASSRGPGRTPDRSALPAPPAALDLLQLPLPSLAGLAAASSLHRHQAWRRIAARSGCSRASSSSQAMERRRRAGRRACSAAARPPGPSSWPARPATSATVSHP